MWMYFLVLLVPDWFEVYVFCVCEWTTKVFVELPAVPGDEVM